MSRGIGSRGLFRVGKEEWNLLHTRKSIAKDDCSALNMDGNVKRRAIIISISSDIGSAMGARWLQRGWDVLGTYRSQSGKTHELQTGGAKLVYCDLSQKQSIKEACTKLSQVCPKWDVLVVCSGSQEPVGKFEESNFDEWESSIEVNFSRQMRVIHALLPTRNTSSEIEPCVLTFAGGGTNNATLNYSAYTASKIALIKMTELLDAEIPDTRFVIVGPGWVKTKIHEATIRAGDRAGANHQRTLAKLSGNECTPMDKVLDCCDWLVESPREVVSGRNFSVVFDKWGTDELAKKLAEDPNKYKLRRN